MFPFYNIPNIKIDGIIIACFFNFRMYDLPSGTVPLIVR